MKINLLKAAAAILALFLVGCSYNSSQNEKNDRLIYAMDTVMRVTVYGDEAALDDAEAEIERLDALLGFDDATSDISKINSESSYASNNSAYSENNALSAPVGPQDDRISVEVSSDTAELLKKASEISASTGGAFDPCIAPVVELWGFYGQKYRVPSQDEIDSELKRVSASGYSVDGNAVALNTGTRLDVGGIAKGYTASKLYDLLKADGIESGTIYLGGSVTVIGAKPDGSPWNVGVQDPDDPNNPNAYVGYISATDTSIVTSGSYQRYFTENGVNYHHIIDPKTGYPADSGLVSVTIVSDDATLCDGLSTALFVMGLDQASDYWRGAQGFEAVFVTDDGSVYITEGLADSFSSDGDYEIIYRDR